MAMRAQSYRKRALILARYDVWYGASPERAVPATDRHGSVTEPFFGERGRLLGSFITHWKRAAYNPRGEIAQLVEQRTENPRVRGSIPRLATIL